MPIVILLIICLPLVLFFSAFPKDGSRRALACGILYTGTIFLIFTYFEDHGVFGDPGSLDQKGHYKALSVASLSDGNTCILLLDENGKVHPVEFIGRVQVNADELCTVVNDKVHGYSLSPIK